MEELSESIPSVPHSPCTWQQITRKRVFSKFGVSVHRARDGLTVEVNLDLTICDFRPRCQVRLPCPIASGGSRLLLGQRNRVNKCLQRCLAITPPALVGPRFIILLQPLLEICLQLSNPRIDLLAEGNAVELCEDGLVEALSSRGRGYLFPCLPHGTGRAELPHPALQGPSLPRRVDGMW